MAEAVAVVSLPELIFIEGILDLLKGRGYMRRERERGVSFLKRCLACDGMLRAILTVPCVFKDCRKPAWLKLAAFCGVDMPSELLQGHVRQGLAWLTARSIAYVSAGNSVAK